MQRAQSLGIDAFALNIGVDSYTDQQLELAYESAANNNMKVFISFDFNWWNTGQASAIGQKIAQYANKPAQLTVDNKVFVSSFAGDGLDVGALRASAGRDIFFAPNFHPSYGTDISPVDGLLNWMAWPNNGNNKAPTSGQNVSVADGDSVYINALKGKAYIAPVSPWFSTHFGPEVSYSKNWVFPSDLLWYNRWNDVLALGPRFIEIVTWNDYGESHYIGPLSSPHTDDGSSRWVNDIRPHDGWLDMAKPFIAAFKDGATVVDDYITADELIYWYRPAPRNENCDATDTCMVPANNGSGNYFIGRPNGWESMQDSVFVVSLLTSPATIQVNSGGSVTEYDAPAGAFAQAIPMNIGVQAFAVSRNGQNILSGTSLKSIIDGCGRFPPTPSTTTTTSITGPTTTSIPTTPTTSTTLTTTTGSVPTGCPTGVTSTVIFTVTNPVTTITSTQTVTVTETVGSGGGSGGGGGGGQPGGGGSGNVCVAGTGPGNYVGLCNFCCRYGYCPPGPCTCTQYGPPISAPPTTGWNGLPQWGEDSSYLGLCSFACNHGYCPSTACRIE
ncbi:alpha-1-3-glucanase/mutanase [Penicillium chermesinum]|uniref:Alpha-1-3-glucanase/mutanase n=1 Tax=Penicillium chermesinum TaxID=63820 RepID=A0A9W9P5Q8_9EURO|nr:alpha-1-3-glucanase/mutanase [Penicillium chermesinum]KAJ5238310.1 alpha-1-3-glucanase/mutanase [Penicillium chermesinum]